MRLKRLQVRGFKSFADKTEFEFDANLTGIVGPNGCGKSNVVDALKWVLGDQRARSLRGAEMTDVIFKGAEGRDQLGAAEVSVVLEADPDAPGGGLIGGMAEVSLGRRLNRDKESSYLINGEAVRLKDVRDLLMDTGLGVGAYSVMEQGRIDAVLSANPEDRRAIFEEAAGISRFKIQKRETLRKLERTEQNLARVKDLLEERARRIRSLKIQAGKARRYREVRGRLRDLRASIAVLDARAVRAREAEESRELAELQLELRAATERVETASASLAELDRQIAEREAALTEAEEHLRRAHSQQDAERNQATGLEHRAAELRLDAQGSAERAASLAAQHDERKAALRAARERLSDLETELRELHEELEDKRSAARAGQARVKALQAARERSRERMLEWIHDRTRCRNLAHDQEAHLRGVDVRAQRVEERSATVAGEAEARRTELANSEVALHDVRQRLGALERDEQRVMGDLQIADREVAELARLEGGLRERLASARSRLEVLAGMEAHLEGLDAGPKLLLEEGAPGLRGRLLDLIDIDLDCSRALEAALGPFVQALVCDTQAAAEAMIARLAAEEKGRAILLIADQFGAGEAGAAGAAELAVPADLPDGCEPLTGRVRCAGAAREIVTWLCGDVVLCDSIERAPASRRDLCFVDRQGTLRRGPRIEGGAGGNGQGLVVRRAQIHYLEEETAQLEEQLLGLQGDMHAGADRVADLRDHASELALLRQDLREREQGACAAQSHLRARLDEHGREQETLELERRELSLLRHRALGRLGEHLLGEHLVRRQENRESAREAAFGAELELERGAADTAVREEQDVRVRQVACATDREAHTHKIEALGQALLDLDRAAAELDERLRAAREGAETADREARARREAVQVLDGEIAKLRAARDDAAARLGGERTAKAGRQGELGRLQEACFELQERLTQKRLEIADSQHRFQRLEERLRADVQVELRRCLGEVVGLGLECREVFGPPAHGLCETIEGPPLPPRMLEAERALARLWELADFDLDAARKECQVLQSQLDRLGAVNLDAVEELEDEQAKFSGLERDVVDLTDSRKSLMEALRRMEVESRNLFEQTFAVARENFKTIFRKLFQGGRADMFLTETEDSLESGIEIVAKPPGKELQSIGLLSGGERSLTALAILFAVFKVKPSPFCILDEVDAALDDTNVERFLRVLDDFVGPSQFCIVTHHKRTMAHCEMLYGITMEKRGVSTRLAVSLDEVDEFATTAAANAAVDRASARRIAGEERVGF